ncbi:MAG: DUF167 domain-containing protein [Hyphomicrobiales bacterium]
MAGALQNLLRTHKEGVLLRVRVTPKSSANRIDGFYHADDGAVSLIVRVTAQPEKGTANKAVIETLAKGLGYAKSKLSITAGETSRNKTVLIRSELDEVKSVLAAMCKSIC